MPILINDPNFKSDRKLKIGVKIEPIFKKNIQNFVSIESWRNIGKWKSIHYSVNREPILIIFEILPTILNLFNLAIKFGPLLLFHLNLKEKRKNLTLINILRTKISKVFFSDIPILLWNLWNIQYPYNINDLFIKDEFSIFNEIENEFWIIKELHIPSVWDMQSFTFQKGEYSSLRFKKIHLYAIK